MVSMISVFIKWSSITVFTVGYCFIQIRITSSAEFAVKTTVCFASSDKECSFGMILIDECSLVSFLLRLGFIIEDDISAMSWLNKYYWMNLNLL